MTKNAAERLRGAMLTSAILGAAVATVMLETAGGGTPGAVATAYVGPGAGLSAIGALLALVAGVFVAIFGFLWYPVKRLLRALRGEESPDPVEPEA